MGGGIKKEDRRCACPLMFLKINFQNLIIIHTCGGEAPAHILAVYSCLDSPTVYSVLVGVALSLHFQALFLCLARVNSSGNLITLMPLNIRNSGQYFLYKFYSIFF